MIQSKYKKMILASLEGLLRIFFANQLALNTFNPNKKNT